MTFGNKYFILYIVKKTDRRNEMELLIRNKETGESYKSETAWGIGSIKDSDGDKYYDSRDINTFLRSGNGAELSNEHYQTAHARDEKDGSIIKTEQITTTTRWQDQPATTKQYDYIRTLGYYDFEENMTKAQASKVIDMIKAGEAGSLNMMRFDGSY